MAAIVLAGDVSAPSSRVQLVPPKGRATTPKGWDLDCFILRDGGAVKFPGKIAYIGIYSRLTPQEAKAAFPQYVDKAAELFERQFAMPASIPVQIQPSIDPAGARGDRDRHLPMALPTDRGDPLDPVTRSFMEGRFGFRFGDVRVHTNSKAAESARRLNALAYTVGQDVVFGAGQYRPLTNQGLRLLAHELTHTIQQRGRSPRHPAESPILLQRQTKGGAEEGPAEWKSLVDVARQKGGVEASKKQAEQLFKDLIIRAAKKVPVPPPLPERLPESADIDWSWKVSADSAALMDAKRLEATPENFWRWISFNPGAVKDAEIGTMSVLSHELDHAAHALTLYRKWKAAPTRQGTWPDFWIAHYSSWTEEELPLTDLGPVSVMEGLPKRIMPSAIEFRAYARQFVEYFHKTPLSMQGQLALGLLLFYPLKKQAVKAEIGDPELDLQASRKSILDYFANPPTKDETQRDAIRALMAREFRSARIHRMADYPGITEAFKPVFDLEIDPEELREFRAKYRPEGQ